MEAKSYGVQFLIFEMLISHWWRPRFLLAVNPCDRTVNSFPKWYDNWKLAKKWGRESQFLNLVTFLTNTKNFKNPWLGAPGTFFGLFQWCQGMFLKVPEGFQRKKFSSCPDTLLLPITTSQCAAARARNNRIPIRYPLPDRRMSWDRSCARVEPLVILATSATCVS